MKTDLELFADKDLLFQTVSNLIDNAIKYTPEGGEITIALDQTKHGVDLTIADSGIGIPEDERGKVFDRFYRVAKSRSLPGNGLGLSLVQAVVELHQGKIMLGDNNPGLVVTLNLPLIKKKEAAPKLERPENLKASQKSSTQTA
ncbi:hypothetical protein A3737_27630 [Oleiphilus sp. HI0065]|nr:hypothetical protein A3737_27630 [Oleiphilus sp. HI0065]